MKISIRTSILGILLTLLLGVSFFIIRVNYLTINTILLQSAKGLIEHAVGEVVEHVTKYFQPLARRTYVGITLIKNKIVIPGNSEKFMQFLHGLIVYEPEVSAIYWADSAGNYYLLKKSDNNLLESEVVLPTRDGGRTIEKTYNAEMKVLSNKEKLGTSFDPRLRPWFQQAIFIKKHNWFISPLRGMKPGNFALGIASIFPTYNKAGKLIGILGLDMPLSAISNFVSEIKITSRSVIIICDEQKNLLSAYTPTKNLLGGYKILKLSDLNKPWVEASFDLYHKKNEPIFLFRYNHQKYLAAYHTIPTLENRHDWHIAIITPIQDIIAPLQQILFISLMVVVGGLLFGVIIATHFSSKISNPIKKLANDAELICQMRLPEVKKLISGIKEISRMGEAFAKMKNVLDSFQRYVPAKLVKYLLCTGEVAEVGGQTRELSILFSDIENFSPLAEIMSPEELMHYLSEYFQTITKIILSTNGTIDKYMGDGVMAFWGAPAEDPHHAIHVCQAALQIKEALKQLNNKWQQEGKPVVATRIGINTGIAVIGNVGSDDRLSYTSIGDPVNVASRLENLNKCYGTYTMISETTYSLVKDKFKARLIDKVIVKGRTSGMLVYELINIAPEKPDLVFEQYNKEFSQAFQYYQSGAWQKALELFTAFGEKYPQDFVSKVFIKRCQNFIKNPPAMWDGAWIVESTEKFCW